MIQGILETGGPLWGWDGDDDDWGGAVLVLLALAVVAATALALNWFGSGQDQEAAGPTAPSAHPVQAKAKVSGGSEGQSPGQGKPGPPGHREGGPTTAGAQDPGPPGGSDATPAAQLPVKTTGEVAGRGALGQHRGNATPGAPRGKGRAPPRPDAALLGRSTGAGAPAPLLIRFAPRSPGSEAEVRVEAAGAGAQGPARQARAPSEQPDTGPWRPGVGPPGSLGRGRGSPRTRLDTSSGHRACRPPKLDPLRLGPGVSVWDAVAAASTDAWDAPARGPRAGSRPPRAAPGPGPQEPPTAGAAHAGLRAGGAQGGPGGSGVQPAAARARESRETGSPAPSETRGTPAGEEGWTWARGATLVTSSFSPAWGAPGASPEGPLWEVCDAGRGGPEKPGGRRVGEGRGSPPAGDSGKPARPPDGGRPPAGPPRAPASPPPPRAEPESRPGLPAAASARSPSNSAPLGVSRGPPAPAPAPPPAPGSASAPASPPAPAAVPARCSPPSPSPVGALAPAPRPPPVTTPSPPSPPAPAPAPPSPPAPPSSLTSPAAPAPVTAATPTSIPAPSPTSPQAPAPAVAGGSRPPSGEPRAAPSKGSREAQASASWGNLIAMVLRSHPFPRQAGPPGAPRTVPGSSAEPGASTQPGSHAEGALASPQDRQRSPPATVARAGSGGPTEARRQPQPLSFETSGAPAPGPPPGPHRADTEEEGGDLPPPAAQPGPAPSPPVSPGAQPVPLPRKRGDRDTAQSPEWAPPRGAPGQPQGPPPAGTPAAVTEQQRQARKLMAFLQRPGSWGVAEAPGQPRPQAAQPAAAAAWPGRLDLGSCLEALALAQRRGEPGLARESYVLMSDNLLRVLGDPQLYRRLSGADRERILSLRTGRGRAVLGVLVLPGLYPAGRPGPARGAHGEGAPPLPRALLHVFSPRENAWRPLTRVPAEAPLRGCGLCTMHNYLFLAGGVRGSGARAICSNEVFCYNPLTDVWSQLRPMRQARAQLKLVALDGLLYAIGGECLYSMERYDPRTDAWTARAPLPEGTFPVAHEAVACRGDIYVTGGHLFYRLLRYSPTKDSWDECPYSASHRRSSDMVALGGFLYRFDLLRGVGAAVMRYNTVTGSWSRAASLPLPDPAPLRCAVLGNTIYCLNHQVTATFTVSEGTAQFQAKELQPFPLGSKGVLCPFTLTLPTEAQLQTSL